MSDIRPQTIDKPQDKGRFTKFALWGVLIAGFALICICLPFAALIR